MLSSKRAEHETSQRSEDVGSSVRVLVYLTPIRSACSSVFHLQGKQGWFWYLFKKEGRVYNHSSCKVVHFLILVLLNLCVYVHAHIHIQWCTCRDQRTTWGKSLLSYFQGLESQCQLNSGCFYLESYLTVTGVFPTVSKRG